MNRQRSRIGLVAVAAIVSTSACGYHPPHPGMSVSMSKVTAAVLYGAVAAAVLPGALILPPPPAAQQVLPTQYISSPEPVRATPSATKLDSCPAAHSTAVEHPTVNRVVAAPVAATYPFRATVQSSARGGHRLNDIAETRQVSKVTNTGNTIDFTVTATYPFLGAVEKTDYQIVTSSQVPSEAEGSVPAGTLSGVYVTGQSVSGLGGTTTSSVTWSPPLQVLKLPAAPGETWAVSSTDQKTGEVETLTAKIDAISQVNACGTLVQGYQVNLSGELVTPGQPPVTVNETELIAPQFGALVLADDASVTLATSTQQVSDTINVTPKLPAGSGS